MKTPIKLAYQTVPLGTSGVRYTALAGLLSLALFTTATANAADFTGSLISVSITDSAGANKAPSAVINYTKDGNTVVFNASKSNDPDGSIVKYTWDFGDSTQASGLTAAHNYSAGGVYNVSLTVVDDKGGGTITQLRLNTASGFSDDFSSDTKANYTKVGTDLGVGVTIAEGVAKGSAQYQNNLLVRGSTGSTHHYAQADVEIDTGATSGIIVGATAPGATSTGYFISSSSVGYVKLYSFSGGTLKDTGKYWVLSENAHLNTFYKIKVVKVDSTFTLYLNVGTGLNLVGNLTDSTYTTGTYVGVGFNQSGGYAPRVDNFEAGL